jgi:hypothetical protein
MARELSFYLVSVQPNKTTGALRPPAWEDPSSSYGAPFVTRFHPTWSTRWEESNLPTYRGGNNRGKASDERAARVVFNGGGDWVRRHSDSKGFSSSGGVGMGSSSKWRIGAGVSGKVARRQHRNSAMVARVWAKSAWDRALLIGVFAPNPRWQKS